MGRADRLRLLLDTHTLLWADADDPRLSAIARAALEDDENQLMLSAVSALEIAIKVSLDRLDVGEPPGSFVASRITAYRLEALPVSVAHALRVGELPRIHRDPFDRLLTAQAQVEQVPIITDDPQIARYDVRVVW